MSHYLLDLMVRLAEGIGRLPPDQRQRHADYLLRQQNADGGFPGRDGESDLYYTGFALRALAVLDRLTPTVCERSAEFLRNCLSRQTSVVDFFSFLYASLLIQTAGGPNVLEASPEDWPQRVAQTLETFRTSDGGYNKMPGANSASTYHTFLVGLCLELVGRSYPQPEQVVGLARQRRRDDGGFVEISAMRRSGTNPTAAGIGILQLVLGSDLPAEEKEATVDFLLEMGSMEGGLRANDRIPLADLLSTFTGLWTLLQLGGLDRFNRQQGIRFALANECPDGGFKAGLWDEVADVEYTFYGLGILGLLT